MKNMISKLFLLIPFFAFMSCTGQKSDSKIDNDAVATEVEEYARLHLGGIALDEKREMNQLMNDRTLHLMLFNEKMERIGETKLAEHRYNNFTGWSISHNGIALFVDNILDEGNDTEELVVDMVRPNT